MAQEAFFAFLECTWHNVCIVDTIKDQNQLLTVSLDGSYLLDDVWFIKFPDCLLPPRERTETGISSAFRVHENDVYLKAD